MEPPQLKKITTPYHGMMEYSRCTVKSKKLNQSSGAVAFLCCDVNVTLPSVNIIMN
jgi:hypothetical protein